MVYFHSRSLIYKMGNSIDYEFDNKGVGMISGETLTEVLSIALVRLSENGGQGPPSGVNSLTSANK